MLKLSADWIFDGRQFHPQATLIIETNGEVADLLFTGDGMTTPDDAEYYQGILTPGFINAHCHLELSHMKGLIPKGTGLVDFILRLQRTRPFPEEVIINEMRKAEEEMRSGGIVGIGDISNSAVSFSIKERSELYYYTFIETFGFDPEKAEAIFEAALELQKIAGRQQHHSIPGPAEVFESRPADPSRKLDGPFSSIVPHSPYSVSEKLFRLIAANRLNGQKPALLSIHNQESLHEDPFYHDRTGDISRLYSEFGIDISFYRPYSANALLTWLPWLGSSGKKLLVHNTYTTAGDVEFALEQGETFWCLCPNANLYIENRLPDIPLFVRKGLNMVLGTDSLASNDSLSILDEMRTISDHFPEIELEQLLRWATRSGAEFFGWEQLGSFEKGKKPGVNLLTGLDGMRLAKQTRVTPLVSCQL